MCSLNMSKGQFSQDQDSAYSQQICIFPGKLLYEINKVILAKTGYDHPILTQLFSLFPSSLSVYTHVYSYMSIIHAK